MQYLFQLGRERDLALAELAAVLPAAARPVGISHQYLEVASPERLDTRELQTRLGSTVAISRVVERLPRTTPPATLTSRLTRLAEEAGTRNLGLSWLTPTVTAVQRRQIGLEVKRALKVLGRSIRLVTSSTPTIRSVVVHDQLLPPRGTELLILGSGDELIIAQTETAQDWRAWSRRDYGRPVRHPRRGMLPPKLARTMVNLAQVPINGSLLDPFCGVGTVLMEAALLGHRTLIGSDRDPKAIEATRLNWTWLRHTEGVVARPQFVQSSIENLSQAGIEPVEAIVSEADLGPADWQRLSLPARAKQMVALGRQYEIWLRTLQSLLVPGGRLVLATPLLRQPRTELNLASIAQKNGWEILPPLPPSWAHLSVASPLTYARPDQLIGRQLLLLRKPGESLRHGT